MEIQASAVSKQISLIESMCAQWIQQFNPVPILERIRNLRDLAPNSNMMRSVTGSDVGVAASDQMHFLNEYESLLLSTIRFAGPVPDGQKSSLMRQAIFTALSDDDLTPDRLINEISDLEGDYLSQPTTQHVLIGTLSVRYDDNLTHREVEDTRITFNNRGRKEFRESGAWGRKLEMEDDLVPRKRNRNYTNFRAFTKARSEGEAFENALTAVDYVRAIWNLRANLMRFARFSSGGKEKPVNQVIYGPRFVLRSSERIWGEREALPPIKPLDIADEYEKLRDFEQDIRGLLRGHPYRKDLDELLLRYVGALDKRSMASTHLSLWSLLESLTGSPHGHETVADRALFLWPDDGIQGQMLKHLQWQRNQYVHEDSRREDMETMVFLLKRYVEELLLYHLNSGQDHSSLEEAAQFLDHPRNQETLRAQIDQKKAALERRLDVSESYDDWRERIQAATNNG
ncbi:hypothetical protein GGQ07_001610 [Salinibacter ruber]|uniref:hypothetical protein n=1 Tax=Salinibacter ruber TaxID=146919 RepID=UPI00216A89C3|nr:hypothetical protein [Salinibacter ruber]MCS4180170.1 hypothetical protein [Salinibacter ruber]